MINTARLLKYPTPTTGHAPRAYSVTHRNRSGFIERQDGSWIHLPLQASRQNKPKARRRLWHWLAGLANN